MEGDGLAIFDREKTLIGLIYYTMKKVENLKKGLNADEKLNEL